MKIVTPERWKIAQDSEKEYWNEYNLESLKKEEIERHKKKAKILENDWASFTSLTNKTKILQVGCGPEDVINYFSKGELYSIDPLAEFYKKKFGLDYKNVQFVQARGEEIPFPDKTFDVVIIANVLDHVESPEKVFSEIKRVLKEEGILHFENLFYQNSFLLISKVWGPIKRLISGQIFNIHHPFMFSLKNLERILSTRFKVIHEEVGREIALYETLEELKRIRRKDTKFTTRLLAKFGLYGTINYMAICKKKNY